VGSHHHKHHSASSNGSGLTAAALAAHAAAGSSSKVAPAEQQQPKQQQRPVPEVAVGMSSACNGSAANLSSSDAAHRRTGKGISVVKQLWAPNISTVRHKGGGVSSMFRHTGTLSHEGHGAAFLSPCSQQGVGCVCCRLLSCRCSACSACLMTTCACCPLTAATGELGCGMRTLASCVTPAHLTAWRHAFGFARSPVLHKPDCTLYVYVCLSVCAAGLMCWRMVQASAVLLSAGSSCWSSGSVLTGT
jgi:hypothetical protein